MGILYELATKYNTLSIVGMAKNAGKTTALNVLIEEAADEGLCLGVTSTGRDGENTDLVTGTDKPRVYLYEDTVVSVPTQLYDLAEAGLEIMQMSAYRTSMGELLLCRVVDSGYVQIAGPVATADTKRMCEEMFHLGCSLVLIDGAIDRKSIAAPETSDAIILATGAVLSRNLKKVVEETAHVVHLYQLPKLEPGPVRDSITAQAEPGILLIGDEGVRTLDLQTGLGASRFIDAAIDEHTRYVFLPGAFTGSVVADIHPDKLKQVTFVLRDPTKIFFDAVAWRQLVKKGFSVRVLQNITVAAVTVNPVAPSGYAFDQQQLLQAMQEALPEIPVVDVRM